MAQLRADARAWAAGRVIPRLLRTRPSVVEALQVTAENRDQVIDWIGQDTSAWSYGTRGLTWVAPDVGGIADAFLGDWVVKTAWGEFVRVSDEAIFSRYESITPVVSE
jgi:hypothetical protein